MLMTFLSRLMSSLLTTLLFVAVAGFTASQTVLNVPYVEQKLADENAYVRLSDALSTQISQKSQDPRIPQELVATQLKTVLTPEVLKAKVDTTLKQLQAYYRGDGPIPTLDITDLLAQAEAAGLQLEASKYEKPVELTPVSGIKSLSDAAGLIGIGLAIVMVLLFSGILIIAIKRRDFRPFANIAFSLGLMLSITGAALLFVPAVFNRIYTFNQSSNPIGTLVHDVAIAAVHDFGIRLLIPGIIILLVGLVGKLLLRRRKTKQPLEYARAEAPTILNDMPSPPPRPVSIVDVPTTPTTQPTESTPGAPPAPRAAKKPRKLQF